MNRKPDIKPMLRQGAHAQTNDERAEHWARRHYHRTGHYPNSQRRVFTEFNRSPLAG